MRSSYGIDFDLDVDECRVSSPMSIVGPSEVGGGRRRAELPAISALFACSTLILLVVDIR
jgi:hypothetical protein